MLRLLFVAQTRDNKKKHHPLLLPFPRLEPKDQHYNIESNAELVSSDRWRAGLGASDRSEGVDWRLMPEFGVSGEECAHGFTATRKGWMLTRLHYYVSKPSLIG